MSDEWAIPATTDRPVVICPDCYRLRDQIAPILMSYTPDPDAAYYLPDGTRVSWADGGERLYCMRCWWSCLRSTVDPELLGWD